MEREIVELRKQIASQQTSPAKPETPSTSATTPMGTTPIGNGTNPMVFQGAQHAIPDQYMGSHEAVASLLDLRSGFDGSSSYLRSPNNSHASPPRRIEDVSIPQQRVSELFDLYVGD